MQLIMTLYLLMVPNYEVRQKTIHDLKVSPVKFTELTSVYKLIPTQKYPELSLNLKEVLWHKWQDEKLTFYFEPDTYYYEGEKEKLLFNMREDFEREIRR